MNRKPIISRKALLLGATGLVGNQVLHELLRDPHYTEITILARNRFLQTHRKLKVIESDFINLDEALKDTIANDVFCCLGTTIKKAGSPEAFKVVDFSLVVRIAEMMKKQGAEQFLTISAMGANSNSKIFYNRVKGEMEEAVQRISYQSVKVLRPSLLLGHRKEFRLAERIGIWLSPLVKLFLVGSLKKYAPIEAEKVAQFMVKIAIDGSMGPQVYESEEISISSEIYDRTH
jgi:uncharacterized protein YbjT (DUF2867 family)